MVGEIVLGLAALLGITVYTGACALAAFNNLPWRATWTGATAALFFVWGWSIWGLVFGWQDGPGHLDLVRWIGAPLIVVPVMSFAVETRRRVQMNRDLLTAVLAPEPDTPA